MRAFLIRSLFSAFALWAATLIVSGVYFDFHDVHTWWGKFGVVFLVAVVFGLVNGFIKPVVQFLSIPLYILTLGLFHIIINALMLELTSWLTGNVFPWGLEVRDFWWSAVWGAVVISIVGWLTSMLLPEDPEKLYT
ncbi:MAG: phage holin family protein [Gordonia sp. (in: high G+C Gram-positive bacteria)]